MADNLGHKAAKLAADKSKAAHPTTLSTGGAAGPQRKKTPAFQITSVTVVNTRPSTDGGDDSADDLDESHTDDTSDVVDVSRVTDVENETPSFSEDTFSKEDVFFNAATASLGSAPVIPTSSQYGLALLGGEGGAQPPASAQQQAAEPAAAAPDSAPGKQQHQDAEMRDVHATGGRNERFKVVKIESTVPFKRGRWTCMDYLDHSTLQHQQQAVINVTESGSVKYCGTDSGVVLTDNAESHEPPHHQQPAYGHQNLSAAQTQGAATVSPGQTLQQLQHVHQQVVPAHLPQSMSQVQMPPQNLVSGVAQAQQQHQSLPPHQFQQVMANAQQQQQAQSYVGQQSPVIVSQQPSYYTPPASGVVTSVPLQTSGVSTLASAPVVAVSHPQVTVVPVVSQVQPAHHSAPVVHVASQPQMEQKMQHVPVQQIPIQQVAVHQQPQVAVQQQQPQVAQQQPQVAVQQQPVLQQHQMQHPGPQIHLQQAAPPQTQPVVSAQHLGPQQPLLPNPHGLPPTSAPLIQPAAMMTVPGTMMAQSPLAQMQTVVMQPTSSAPVFVPHAPQISVSQPNVVPVPLTTVYQNPALVGATASLPATQWTNAAQAAPVGPPVTVAAVEPVVNPVKETSQPEGGAPLKVDPSDISKNSDDSSVTVPSVVEDTESASGTSAVAIDNKIEQAMDLVKSHLMFAVREEVEVLKERIAELMDRIGQLEMENTILKAHATQEALAQLGQPQQQSQLPAGNGSSAS